MAGEHRDGENTDTDTFRGALFTDADFTGATFRACDLRSVKVVDSWLVDLNVSAIVGNLRVNEVDVTAFVEAELDRRHPERVQLRAVRTPDDHRAMWDTIERIWSAAVDRARRLPEPAREERVDDEWSFVETMRHAAAIGIDVDARPSFDEVMEVRAERMARVRRLVDGLTDEELVRQCTRSPAPGYPDEPRSVAACLRVVMDEECEHHRYAVRDLAVLEVAT